MVKILMGLGLFVVLMSMVALATVPDIGEPVPKPAPLEANDYIPPLTQAEVDAIHLVDLRPDEVRFCDVAGQWWDSEGCNLRGIIMSCYSPTGLWSRDFHIWEYDGWACRYSVETEDAEAPQEAQR